MGSQERSGVDRWARGRAGEQAAVLFLSGRGYRVLATNQRTPLGELDVVCRKASEIVVVEVKARSSSRFGEALESVGPRKARRIRAAATWWLTDRHLLPCPVRFDVITVVLNDLGKPLSVRHFENVFCG